MFAMLRTSVSCSQQEISPAPLHYCDPMSAFGDIELFDGDEKMMQQYAHLKRLFELLQVDTQLRSELYREPLNVLDRYGLELSGELLADVLYPVPHAPAHDVVKMFWAQRRVAAKMHDINRNMTGMDPQFATWRADHIARCDEELPQAEFKAHASVAIELSTGCSVGCWFCAVSADSLTGTWSYTAQTAAKWKEYLEVFRGYCGDSIISTPLYWATDPLDNKNYVDFVRIWIDLFGQAPVTTTAQPMASVEQTRRLAAWSASESFGSFRISVTNRQTLTDLYEAFSPVDLIGTTLIMQLPGGGRTLKRAGRTLGLRSKRVSADLDTIACVSGFLFNPGDGLLRLISPVIADADHPEGFLTLGCERVDSPEHLRGALSDLVSTALRNDRPETIASDSKQPPLERIHPVA